MGQGHLQKLLLLFLLLKTLLDLIEGLLRSEMWLVVEALDRIFRILTCRLLRDLVAQKFTVDPILLLLVLTLYKLYAVHVVNR